MASIDELQAQLDAAHAELTQLRARADANERRLNILEQPDPSRKRDDRIPQLAAEFDVKDAIFRPHASIVQRTAQIPGIGVVTVTMDATLYDNNFMSDLANDRLVVRTAGIYFVEGFVRYLPAATGGFFLYVYVGAVPQFSSLIGTAAAGAEQTLWCGGLIKLNVGNLLTLRMVRTDPADTTVIHASSHNTPFLEAFWVAPVPNNTSI